MNLQICATGILMQADRGVASEVQRAFRRRVEANGLTSRTPDAAQLRHCFAPHPLQAVYDMPTVEELLGHASPTTTTPTKGRILGAEHELPKAAVVISRKRRMPAAWGSLHRCMRSVTGTES
jgi:integrase